MTAYLTFQNFLIYVLPIILLLGFIGWLLHKQQKKTKKTTNGDFKKPMSQDDINLLIEQLQKKNAEDQANFRELEASLDDLRQKLMKKNEELLEEIKHQQESNK